MGILNRNIDMFLMLVKRVTQRLSLRLTSILFFVFFSSLSVQAQVEPLKPELDSAITSQVMTQEKMADIIAELSPEYEGSLNNIQFSYNDVSMALVSDKDNNRMRIIAPITSVENVTDEHLKAAMVSNFHLALDARYAIGRGVVYATFIHPLKELTPEQIKSAVRQVSSLRLTFGTTFTSGELQYGGRNPAEEDI